MESRNSNKLFIIATILLVVLLAGLFKFQKIKEQEKTGYLVEYKKNVEAMSEEKTLLKTELANLEEQFRKKYAGLGTVSLIFTDLDYVVYEEIRPEMENFKMTGVLMLSQDQFPGAGGCISMAQFQQMIAGGWDYCLEWSAAGQESDEWNNEDGENSLELWLSQMQTMLSENNLEMPKVIYFRDGTYQKQYDATLKKFGITTAVHHGENEEPMMAVTFEKGAVWRPGAYPMNVQGARSYVDTCVKEKGSMAFSIGMRNQKEMYTRSSMISMLEQLQERVEDEKLKVMTIQQAYEYREQLEADAAKDLEMLGKIEAVEKQIEDVELRMKQLREKYREDTGK